MDHLIAFARRRGIQQLFGEVLQENTIMLSLCRDLGFSTEARTDALGTVRVTLALQSRQM
jgi:acetyltransferase